MWSVLIPATEDGLHQPPARDLWTLISARANATPDLLLAIDAHGRSVTFGEYATSAERVAAHLHGLGLRSGTAVSWQLRTGIDAMVLVAALARLGALQNPLLPAFRERELRLVFEQVRPRWFITTAELHGGMDALFTPATLGLRAASCDLLLIDDGLPEGNASALPPVLAAPSIGNDPIRWVFFSSGTTAEPKGARHTDASVIAGAIGQTERFELVPSDRYGIVFPFTHVGGIGTLATQLLSGAGAIVVEKYDPASTPALFARHGLTVLAGGTPMALLTLEAQRRRPDEPIYPDLRLVIAGASPKPPGLHAAVQRELGGRGTLSVYGLTEAPVAVISAIDSPDADLAEYEGRANICTEVRIVEPSSGAPCPPGTAGEIRIRGAILCAGYLDSSATAEAFDDEGFLRTGDIGYLDATGNLAVTGRIKDIIIRKGENISAKEVEDLLFEHPAIAEVAVIGLPDPQRGERCCAVMTLRDGASPLDLNSLAAFCRDGGLAVHKIPEQIEVLTTLPRSAGGKVAKTKLKEQFAG